jgi:preprotein translocase subunit SecD
MLALSRWKIVLVLGSVIFGILFSLPNVLPDSTLASWPSFLPHQRLNLGLDLQGGSSLLYEVDTDALTKERLADLGEEATQELRDAQVQFQGLSTATGVLTLKITNPAQIDQAATALAKVGTTLPGVGREVLVTHDTAGNFQLALTQAAIQQGVRNAVAASIEIIRRRIDTLGTKEPDIREQGADRIAIEAPGESDPQKLRQVIGQTGKLTFQMVDETIGEHGEVTDPNTPVPPYDAVLADQGERGGAGYVVVAKRISVDGAMLTHANQGFDQNNNPNIQFRLNGVGAHRFGQVTAENIGHQFAIVLDNKVISHPVIQGAIEGGQGEITGNFTLEQAGDLANVLNSGALPARLNVVQEGTVSADLGADAVQAGVTGLLIGAALIFAFIILAYGLFGVFAAIALIVNTLLMVGALSMTQATLTLPGIAGLILTMAVAVDANVLIYERMRDEANAGRPAMAAADHGYQRALTSIFDANVTTMIAALIMFSFGAGPVKGFAWTLSIGVVTSVFSAILVTQLLIGWWFRITRAKTLPIA